MTRIGEFVKIPFNKPYLNGISSWSNEVESGYSLVTGGKSNVFCKKFISEIAGGGEVFLTASCTQALEFATLLLDLKPGDEVIIPSFNFTSGVISLVNYGVIPIFVDVDPINLNLDCQKVESLVSPKTRAISWINYAGRSPDIDKLREIANKYNLFLIEDNAHGFTGTFDSKPLGSFGDVSVLSFHSTKNITCGEGGALVINNSSLSQRAHVLKDKGTNRKEFFEGGVEKYQWQDKGGSFLLAEPLCEILVRQLSEIKKIQERRRSIFLYYYENLQDWILNNAFVAPTENQISIHASHIFYFMLKDNDQRSRFIKYMNSLGIETPFHYQALHATHAGASFGKTSDVLENSLRASQTLVRLPIWYELTSPMVEDVVEAVRGFRT